MRLQSPISTNYRSRRQVGGLLRYLRPLGATWVLAALGLLVLAACWVLHGKGDATLSTAREVQPASAPSAPSVPSGSRTDRFSDAVPSSPSTQVPAPTPAPAAIKTWVQVTAYCPCSRCCGRWARSASSRRFADGTTPVAGTDFALAADTDLFPFGTRIRVPGYADGASVPVLDTGRAVKGRHIEVFLHGDNAHRRAQQWGSRWLEIEVLTALP